MKKKLILILGLLLIGLSLGKSLKKTKKQEPVLRFLSHDSFNVSKKLIETFEQENGVKIEFLQGGDAGSLLNTAILNKNNPTADILFGVDNTFLSRALEEDLFEVYQPLAWEKIQEAVKIENTDARLTPIDYGDVCLNYDKAWFVNHNLALPEKLEDLVKPEYQNLLVVENPASSSPGLAFLLATIAYFGDPGYLDFWRQLKLRGVKVVDGWEEAYWGEFSAAGSGNRPLVVSYATSPAAEVYFSEGKYKEPPTGALIVDNSCFRQIEYAGILKGAKNKKMAKKFIDFMLSQEYQEDIFLQMWMFPSLKKVNLPKLAEDFALLAKNPARVAPEAIKKNREQWLNDWQKAIF